MSSRIKKWLAGDTLKGRKVDPTSRDNILSPELPDQLTRPSLSLTKRLSKGKRRDDSSRSSLSQSACDSPSSNDRELNSTSQAKELPPVPVADSSHASSGTYGSHNAPRHLPTTYEIGSSCTPIEDRPPPAIYLSLPESPPPSVVPPSSKWPTAEEEKVSLYHKALAAVSRTQGDLSRASSPDPTHATNANSSPVDVRQRASTLLPLEIPREVAPYSPGSSTSVTKVDTYGPMVVNNADEPSSSTDPSPGVSISPGSENHHALFSERLLQECKTAHENAAYLREAVFLARQCGVWDQECIQALYDHCFQSQHSICIQMPLAAAAARRSRFTAASSSDRPATEDTLLMEVYKAHEDLTEAMKMCLSSAEGNIDVQRSINARTHHNDQSTSSSRPVVVRPRVVVADDSPPDYNTPSSWYAYSTAPTSDRHISLIGNPASIDGPETSENSHQRPLDDQEGQPPQSSNLLNAIAPVLDPVEEHVETTVADIPVGLALESRPSPSSNDQVLESSAQIDRSPVPHTDASLAPDSPSVHVKASGSYPASQDSSPNGGLSAGDIQADSSEPSIDGNLIKSLRTYSGLTALILDKFNSSTPEDSTNCMLQELLLKSYQIAQEDLISSLVDCTAFKQQLLLAAEKFGIHDSEAVSDALDRDEVEIAMMLSEMLSSPELKTNALLLRDDNAECLLDLLQRILDEKLFRQIYMLNSDISTDEVRKLYKRARRFLRDLARASEKFPPSLFIRGVEHMERDPVYGGGFADIFRGRYRGAAVALKRMRIFLLDTGRHQRTIRAMFGQEALVWRQLGHPNVLPFYGIYSDTPLTPPYMVLPWMRYGNVNRYLQDYEVSDTTVDRLLYEVATGLNYLHTEGVVHGDLRGANILIDDDIHVRLCDFGLALFADNTTTQLHITADTRSDNNGAGSVRWMAPELLFRGASTQFRRTEATDVYAFACVCWELYAGRPPYPQARLDAEVLKLVGTGERPERPVSAGGRKMADGMWERVVQPCWDHSARGRPSAGEVVRVLGECGVVEG